VVAVSIAYLPRQDEIVRDLSRRFMGRVLTEADYAAMVAARPGDRVRLWARLVYPVHIAVWLDGQAEGRPDGGPGEPGAAYTSVLGIARDDGGPHVRLQYIEVTEPEARGRGIGAWVVARQAMAAHQLGIDRVTAYADREHGRDGYYALPRLGFDHMLSPSERGRLPRALAAERLGELMATAAGRAWWRECGWPLPVALDTAPDSRGMKVLRAYFTARGWSWPAAPGTPPVARVDAPPVARVDAPPRTRDTGTRDTGTRDTADAGPSPVGAPPATISDARRGLDWQGRTATMGATSSHAASV
jgi:GNAT superfamily N-acetyltransferase